MLLGFAVTGLGLGLQSPLAIGRAVIAADGNLYFRYQDGIMALIEASPKGVRGARSAMSDASPVDTVITPVRPRPTVRPLPPPPTTAVAKRASTDESTKVATRAS